MRTPKDAPIHQGEFLKQLIKEKKMTVNVAVEKLDMTRQNFYYHVKKDRLEPHFISQVKEKLGIDIRKELGEKENSVIVEVSHNDLVKDMLQIKARLKALNEEVAISKSKRTGMSLPAALDDLDLSTTKHLRDLLNSDKQ